MEQVPTSQCSTPDPDGLPDAAWRQHFRKQLRTWYARHARDLPWRRRSDPYAIWVSEIMLQQTQVATVTPYFERFLAAFPTIPALAAADRQRVLQLWEGLGYYRRASQLHEAAAKIVREHEGQFPRDPQAVARLPGIGRYTAGAILSIAFDARQPILEANTLRLFCRLLGYRGDPRSAAGQRLLWATAEVLLPRRGSGGFNQALMELGGQVCLPRAPHCEACPVAALCRAQQEQAQAEIPRAKVKPPPEPRHEAAVVIHRDGKVLLVQCGPRQRWAGLWDFPRYRVHSQTDGALLHELGEALCNETGLRVRFGRRLATFKHTVTRFRIRLDCYEAGYVSGPAQPIELPHMQWLTPAQLDHYPLCTTGREICRLVQASTSRSDAL
jgi:A/G-specific adenine glycosylase